MKDIILLALSKLGGKRESEFVVEGEDFRGHYEGSMEPLVQYRFHTCPQQETQFVVLCTSATKNDADNYTGMSTYDYFMQQTRKYALEFKAAEPSFEMIDIDEAEPQPGIAAAARYIMHFNDRGELWIGTHGGFRDVVLMLEGVISLLKMDNIVPNRIFGIRYSETNKSEPAKLVDQRESFSVFDFVAGMNEFDNYGRIDILKDHYADTTNRELKKVLEAMEIIADGLQMCSPNRYLAGLDKMNELLGKAQNGQLKTGDALFDVFIDYIRNDYGSLLRPGRSVIGIVERCYDKHMYQQALTFIESLMPELFMDKGILLVDFENDREKIRDAKRKSGMMFASDKQFVFNSFITLNLELFSAHNKASIKGEYDRKYKPDEVKISDYEAYRLLTITNNRGNYQRLTDWNYLTDEGEIVIYNKNNESIRIRVTTNLSEEKKRTAAQLLRLHKALKATRNLVNHSKDTIRPTTEQIDSAISLYIDLARKAFEEHEA